MNRRFCCALGVSETLAKQFRSVVDRHRLDADPEPEPSFHLDADPDQDPTPSFTHVGKSEIPVL